MSVTYIPGQDYSHWARVFTDIADIYLRDRTTKRAEQTSRDENLLKFITNLSQTDAADRDNQLRAIEASGGDAFKRYAGKPIGDVGVSSARATAPGLPVPSMTPSRDIAPNMQEPLIVKGKRLATEGQQLSNDSVRQAMGIAATTEARAAESHGMNVALTKVERMKSLDQYRFTNAAGKEVKATPTQRATMFSTMDKGGSFDDAVTAAGFTGSAIPDALVSQVDDMTNSLTKLGYDPTNAATLAKNFAVTYPMDTARLEPLSKQGMIGYYAAETELTKKKLDAINNPDGTLKASEARLRTGALNEAHVKAYAPWYGSGLSSTQVAADGKTALVTPGKVFGKSTASTKAGWTDSTGAKHDTLPARMVDALIDPLGPSGMAWLLEHGIQPPISPDDVTGIRAVLDAFARETGARIDKITLNVPDPTKPTASRLTIPQDILGYDGIINFVTADRAALMRERVLNGSVPQQGSISYPGGSPTGGAGGNGQPAAPAPGTMGGGVGLLPPSPEIGSASQPSVAPSSTPSPLELAIRTKLMNDNASIDAYAAEQARRRRKMDDK